MLGKVEKILRKTSAGKKFLKELKSAVRDGTKTVDRAVRDATKYINKRMGPSTKLTPGQQQVKPATKAQTVTGNVAKTKFRQGATAGATIPTGVGAAAVGTGKENLSTAQKDMIAAYRAEARKETSSDKQLEKKVAAFKKDFIEKGKPDVKFDKGGSVPKPRKKPYVPMYTPKVYAKFPQFKDLPFKERDRKISMSTESTRMNVTPPPPKPRSKPTPPKLAKGGFPDLSGDGKVTQKDVLMGRGAMNKGGMYAAGGYVTDMMGKKKK